MSDEPQPAECNGAIPPRLRDGKFGPGNKFGKGNPQHAKMHELRGALLDAATPERIRAVGVMLFRMALEDRDASAARLIFEYTLGKPTQAVEVSGPDGEPLGLEWSKMEDSILAALAPFGPAPRFAVAVALRGLATDAGDAEQPGDPA